MTAGGRNTWQASGCHAVDEPQMRYGDMEATRQLGPKPSSQLEPVKICRSVV